MKKKSSPLNSKGLSLVELLVGVGILSILTLVFAQITIDMRKMSARGLSMVALNSEISILQMRLSHPENCLTALGGIVFDPSTSANLSSKNLTDLGLTLPSQDHLQMTAGTLEPAVSLLDSTVVGPTSVYEKYLVNLSLRFETRGLALFFGGKELKPRKLPLQIVVEKTTGSPATYRIVNCSEAVGDSQNFCTLVGGHYDKSMSPNCKLPAFNGSCSNGDIATAISSVSNSFQCSTLPAIQTLTPPTGGNAPPLFAAFAIYTTINNCNYGSCKCPPGYPEMVAADYSTKNAICKGSSTIPPTKDYSTTLQCLTMAATGVNCVSLGGVYIRFGFGPCWQCPL